jgi:FixJ family two-component response regulator
MEKGWMINSGSHLDSKVDRRAFVATNTRRPGPDYAVLVGDDPGTRDIIVRTLMRRGIDVEPFASTTDCITPDRCLMIIDLGSSDVDGLQLLARLRRTTPWTATIILCGHGDVRGAVTAMKAGAMDVLEKPVERHDLLQAVDVAIGRSVRPIQPLTQAEARVLQLVLGGTTNREIAALLSRSLRTIEVHRSRVMQKLNAQNRVELFRSAERLGFSGSQAPTTWQQNT